MGAGLQPKFMVGLPASLVRMGYEDGVADYREEGIWDDVELDDIVQIIVYGSLFIEELMAEELVPAARSTPC